MIKVIIGYKVNDLAGIQSVLFKLRSQAMTFQGFVSAENLSSLADHSIVAMIQSWEQLEDWKSWESSRLRQSILNEAKAFLVEEPRVTLFKLLPASGWDYR